MTDRQADGQTDRRTGNSMYWFLSTSSELYSLFYFWGRPQNSISYFWGRPQNSILYFWGRPQNSISYFWGRPQNSLSYFWGRPQNSISYFWGRPQSELRMTITTCCVWYLENSFGDSESLTPVSCLGVNRGKPGYTSKLIRDGTRQFCLIIWPIKWQFLNVTVLQYGGSNISRWWKSGVPLENKQ